MAIRSPGMIASGKFFTTALLGAALVTGGVTGAQAQFFNNNRPPADVEDQPARNEEASSLLRVDHLENQVRNLNGQVEQLQFQIKRLEDQMRKFQMDVDSRFQESAGHGGARPALPQKRTELPETQPMQDAQAVAPAAPVSPSGPIASASLENAPGAPASTAGRGRHDAYDPNNDPTAPGAPQTLGSPNSASRPVERASSPREPGQPLDLAPPSGGAGPSGPVASLPPAAPVDPVKAEYEAAEDQLKSQHYDAAQQAFSAFVQKNAHSRMIAPAIYHLGESYYFQSRHREAAEQFLKIATDYSKSPVAPEAMIKLGVSLNALGAKEQACAFFSELPRKYPRASAAAKMAAAREAKKASC